MKIKTLLFGALAFFALNTMAEEVTEDFESVSIVDADGNAVSANSFGVGLSNGWMVLDGGTIYADDYTASYGFSDTSHSGGVALVGVSSSNTYIMVIPTPLVGNISFYARKVGSSSSLKAYVDLFEMEQDGSTFKKKSSSSFKYWSLTSTYTKYEYDLGTDAKYIGIRLQKALLDDVVFNTVSNEPHEHSYASEWSYDENEHWHACTSTTGVCDAKKGDVAAHDGVNCSVCGYKASCVESYPWTEDFEGLTNGEIPTGWDNSEGTTTSGSYKWRAVKSYSEGVYMRFDSYNNAIGNTSVLATGLFYIPETSTYELKFKAKNPCGGDYKVMISEFGNSERTVLLDNLTDISSWKEQVVSLAGYAGKYVRFYFCGTSNYGASGAYLDLDDMIIQEHIEHVHQYAETWSTDYTGHWHVCLNEVGDCDAPVIDKALHSLDANSICTVCGYELPFYEDFEHNVPSWWSGASDWRYKNFIHDGVTSRMAYSSTSKKPLTTPLLKAKQGDVIQFNMLREWEDEVFKVEYSINESEEWNEILSTTVIGSSKIDEYTTEKFTAPVDGNYRLRFAGSYYAIDNLTGFKLAPETRHTAEGRFGTICLPYDAVVEGATLYSVAMDADGGAWVTLTPEAECKAGVAYVYQATANEQVFNMSGIAAYTPSTESILKGIYTTTTAKAGTYVMQTHDDVQQFYVVESGSEPTLAPFRAYLQVLAGARTLGIVIEGEETAIDALNAAVENGQIYDLNGRKLNRLQKGINIVNGRTVLVK